MSSKARRNLGASLSDISQLLETHLEDPGATALHRACVVLLSANLEGFVEDLFHEASEELLQDSVESLEELQRQATGRFRNPRSENINNLFACLGFKQIADDLLWGEEQPATIKNKLNEFVILRNRIAHGARIQATMHEAKSLVEFVGTFADLLDYEVALRLAAGFGYSKLWEYEF